MLQQVQDLRIGFCGLGLLHAGPVDFVFSSSVQILTSIPALHPVAYREHRAASYGRGQGPARSVSDCSGYFFACKKV